MSCLHTIFISSLLLLFPAISFSSVDTLVNRYLIPHTNLTVGILSDAQFPENDELLSVGHFGVVMNGPKHVYRALSDLKKREVDLIVMNGDMVNAASGGNAYRTYNLLLDHVFGKERKNMPPLIYPMGNHEFYGADAEAQFMNSVKLPLNTHHVLNGIHIIGISCSDGNGGYSQDRLDYLKYHLSVAHKENPKMPILVVSHMPFNVGGFFGGQWDSSQSDEMYEILSAYPQVVYFCGHSHYPLFDDLCIVQQDFTIINTGTTSYFDLDWNVLKDGKTLDVQRDNEYMNPDLIGIYNQADIPGRDDVNEGWIMDIDTQSGKLVLQRMNYNLSRPFGRKIILEDLYLKNFSYHPDKQRLAASCPRFSVDASIFLSESGVGRVDVCFNAALPDVLVKHYILCVTGPDGKKQEVRFLARGYYGGFDFPYMEHINFRGCKNKGTYLFQVKAVSCFGKESKWLESNFTVR